MKIARQILISGRVQGVGYRYFAQRSARQNEITGYVKNLFDGRVEVFAEGEEVQIERFIGDLRQGPPFGNVENMEIKAIPCQDRYDSFHVAF
jgi:acylphosphatase